MARMKKSSGGDRFSAGGRHQAERNCDSNRSILSSTDGMMGEAGVHDEKGCSEAKNPFIVKSASVSALEDMRRIHDDPLEGRAGLPQTSEPDDGIGSEESLMRNSGSSGSEKDGFRCQIFSSSSSLPLADQGSCVFSSIDSLSSLPQCASAGTILKNPIATCGSTVVSGGVASEHTNVSSALKTEVNCDFPDYLVCCSVDSCVSASDFYKFEMMLPPESGTVNSVPSSANVDTVVANCSCPDGESCLCFRAEKDVNGMKNQLQAGARRFSDTARCHFDGTTTPCAHLQEDPESHGFGKCMMSENRNETRSYESCSKYDSKYLLGLAFDQTKRLKNGYLACSVHSDVEDFRRFTTICESSSELSVSMSSKSCSQSDLVRLPAECGCECDRFRPSGRRISASCSFGTSRSDSVIAVLDLETTGDFPRGFCFQPSDGLLSPPAAAPVGIEKSGGNPSRSTAVPYSVATDYERELDEQDDTVVLKDGEDDESVTTPVDDLEALETTKRNLLRRFLDMTAEVLLGYPVIEAGGGSEGAGRRITRSRSTLVSSRTPVGDDDVRPRSSSASDVPLGPRSVVWGRTAPEFGTMIERGYQKETGSKLPMQEESLLQQENPVISNELGKSQSVETASMQRSSTAGGGMAHRSLDSTWPPNLSRGSSMSTHSEKPGVERSTPQKMVKYKVAEGDTLTSIAARFECLPTEVMKANRMGTRLVFPGQVLTVPARAPSSREQGTSSAASGHVSGVGDDCVFLESNEDLAAGGSDTSAAAGGGRLQTAAGGTSKLPDKYIKVKSRHITDGQGVVSGTLLITPNCLMFDPNVSDPLVLEHGADRYGVIVPLDYIVSAAMYNDIAHMRVKDRADIQLPDLPIPEVYHPAKPSVEPAAAVESSDQSSRPPSLTAVDNSPKMKRPSTPPPSLEDLSATPPLAAEDQQAVAEPTEVPSTLQDVSEESTPSEVGGLRRPLPDVVDSAVASESASTVAVAAIAGDGSEQLVVDGGSAPAAAAQSVQFSPPATSDAAAAAERLDEFDASTKQKVWKRLSHPLTWMESFSGSQEREGATPPNSAPPTQTDATPKSMLSNMYSSVTSVSSAIASSPRYIADLGSGLLSSLSPAEPEEVVEPGLPDSDARCEGNSMFYSQRSSVEKRSRSQSGFSGYINLVGMEEKPSLFTPFDKLIPQPSTASDDPPLYLCLLMGKPAGRKLHKSVRIITYGEPKLRAEIWFSIPKDKCDHIYGFFQYWAPELYGSLETTNPEARGFELVDSDTEIWEEEETGYELVAGRDGSSEDGSGLMDIPRQLPKQSWEMGDMSEEVCRALQISMDMEFIPDLIGKSEVLTEDIRKSLAKNLPPRVEGYPWRLVFSSSEHGFSLKSLYRKSSAYESPMLLVVQDTEGHVFGAVSSCTIQMSEHYYGTGETFLYSFHPHFCVYRWSGENNYYIRGTTDGLEFGSGDGHYGLYLDSDLYRGRTQPCITFRNQLLTTSDDFIIKAIELWGLT